MRFVCWAALSAAERPARVGASGKRGLQRPRWREPALLGLPGSLAARVRSSEFKFTARKMNTDTVILYTFLFKGIIYAF